MSLQPDSIGNQDRQAAGVISGGGTCPYCDDRHGTEVVFCPNTAMALPGARDEFCGKELAGGITVRQPVQKSGALAIYEGRTQDGLKVLIKRLLPPTLDDGPAPSQASGDTLQPHIDLAWEGHVLSLLTDLHFVPRLLSKSQRYLAMEWIEGPTLANRIEGASEDHPSMTLEEAIDGLLSLISAVRILHGRHVYHRALLTNNILIRESDATPVLVGFDKAVSFGHKDAPKTPRPGDSLSEETHTSGPESPESIAKNRDVSSCREITAQVLRAALGAPERRDTETEQDGEHARPSIPEPVEKFVFPLLDRLADPNHQDSLATLTGELEALRMQVERHLQQDESPAGPDSLPPSQAEDTQPVIPPMEQTDAIPLPADQESKSHGLLLTLGAIFLAALAGILWHLNQPKKREVRPAQGRREAASGSTAATRRDAGVPRLTPHSSKPSRLTSDRPVNQPRTVRPHDAGMSPTAGMLHRKGIKKHSLKTKNNARRPPHPSRRGMKPRAPGDQDFVHAVDKAPEDL